MKLGRSSIARSESNDSYLARADTHLEQAPGLESDSEGLQAYVMLRGSNLSHHDDRKRVVLEVDSSFAGWLSAQRVGEAVRTLGATFFQDLAARKKTS